jgi:ribosomal 50S subunit-recycling heat shock protein
MLKGARCFTAKCAFERRPTPPGMHGRARQKQSGYGLQLREKQKVRRVYGVLERQFRSTFEKAALSKGITGENLMSGLERRLDSVIYRMGFGTSRAQARQIVRHGHIDVNGRKCDIPSAQVKVGDVVAVGSDVELLPGGVVRGDVVALGPDATRFALGARVGVPWLGSTCGACSFCRSGRENLCSRARFTGYHLDGGYAEFTAADERYCFALPPELRAPEAAPLLCAGLIGYRSLVAAGDHAERLGLYGFGAAAHIVAQIARAQGRRVFAFTRAGDAAAQGFARPLRRPIVHTVLMFPEVGHFLGHGFRHGADRQTRQRFVQLANHFQGGRVLELAHQRFEPRLELPLVLAP